jgi:hypothetical protein
VTNTTETVGQCERQPLTVHPGGFQISALGEVESVNDRIDGSRLLVESSSDTVTIPGAFSQTIRRVIKASILP